MSDALCFDYEVKCLLEYTSRGRIVSVVGIVVVFVAVLHHELVSLRCCALPLPNIAVFNFTHPFIGQGPLSVTTVSLTCCLGCS